MKSILLSVFSLIIASAAHAGPAAAVHDCAGLDSIGNLIGNVRSFAQGAIRVAYVTTDEPAAAPDHLLIFVADEPMGASCYAVSATAEGRGFSGINMADLSANYDPNLGLLLSVPVSAYDLDKGSVPAGRVKVRVSRKNNNNSVTIEP